MMKTKQQKNNSVTVVNKDQIQSYIMTTAKYDFSVYEKRILYRIVEMAQGELQGVRFATDCKKIEHTLFDTVHITMPIASLLNGESDENYTRVKQALLSLQKKIFTYEDEKEWISISIIALPKIKKRSSVVSFPLASKFRNAGQTCVCANRLYVQDGVYDRFAEKLQQAVSKLHIGDGLDNGVTIGPLIDEKAVAKVEEHIADALEKGARVVCGGKAHERGGNFFQPTILVDVPANAKVSKEETFGPLAPLFRFKDEADVIAQANDTEFGLAAYFYARDLSRVFRVGEALEYGIVGINTGIISNEVAPFGGIKASGLGREGSKYGIEDYLEIKYMCIGL